jgi:hypothetical protein
LAWIQSSHGHEYKKDDRISIWFCSMVFKKQRVEIISSSVFAFKIYFLEFLSVSLSIILRLILYPNNISIVNLFLKGKTDRKSKSAFESIQII